MSETVGYYLMLFSVLHFMNWRYWRQFYDFSDPLYMVARGLVVLQSAMDTGSTCAIGGTSRHVDFLLVRQDFAAPGKE
jgi:hypothetical protein